PHISVYIIFSNYLTSTTHPFSLSLHDALPIYFDLLLVATKIDNCSPQRFRADQNKLHCLKHLAGCASVGRLVHVDHHIGAMKGRSEEHTSELQSRGHLVCRLLLEKKK